MKVREKWMKMDKPGGGVLGFIQRENGSEREREINRERDVKMRESPLVSNALEQPRAAFTHGRKKEI